MKKNIIGHMTAPRESTVGKFKRLRIVPKFLCLLLALLIWLLIVNVTEQKDYERSPDTAETTETAGQE